MGATVGQDSKTGKSCKVAGTLSGIFQIPFCCCDTPTTPQQSPLPAKVQEVQTVVVCHISLLWPVCPQSSAVIGTHLGALVEVFSTQWGSRSGGPSSMFPSSYIPGREAETPLWPELGFTTYLSTPVLFCSWGSRGPRGKKNTVRNMRAALQIKMAVSGFQVIFGLELLSTLSFTPPPLWSSDLPVVSLMPRKRWLRGWGICSHAWKPKFDPLSPHSRRREPTPANVQTTRSDCFLTATHK